MDVIKKELTARKRSLTCEGAEPSAPRRPCKKEELVARLTTCLTTASTATPESIVAAKAAAVAAKAAAKAEAEAAAAAAKEAAKAARAARPSPASWFTKGSKMRSAWSSADGFDGMQHRSLLVGAYVPDVLHAVELRFIGALFARLLRLAKLIDDTRNVRGEAGYNVFARVRETLESIPGIKLTNARGAWHIRQMHGKQVKQLMLHLSAFEFSRAYPPPWARAIEDLLDIWPFYVQATGHALYPQRAYSKTCQELSDDVRSAAHILHVGMSSIFPSVPKDSDDLSKGFYGAFTPPSNCVAVMDVPDLFDQYCDAAGSAANSAAIFEYGHIPCRKIYWATTTRGTQFGERSMHIELLQNIALQKISKWDFFGDFKMFPNVGVEGPNPRPAT